MEQVVHEREEEGRVERVLLAAEENEVRLHVITLREIGGIYRPTGEDGIVLDREQARALLRALEEVLGQAE